MKREKVIATLQNRINEARNNHTKVATIFISTLSDAMALLKAQDPGDPEIEGDGRSSWWYVCPDCHGQVDNGDGYCRHCGKGLRWK